MDLKDTIGKRLKEFRESLGLQQKEIVDGLGISPATWSNYETGSSFPSMTILERLRKTKGLDLNWVIAGEHSLPRSPETVGDFIEVFWNLPLGIARMPSVSAEKLGIRPDKDWYWDPTESREFPAIFFVNPAIAGFLADYRKMNDARLSGAIDDEMMEIWKEKQLRKYKDYPLCAPWPDEDSDPLPM